MTLPLYDNGVASGLLCGVLFGYALESAGFASPRKLTAQFRFTDWSVFKVMFTAIIVAAIGLYGAMAAGLIAANGIFIPTTFFWATLAGGALVGAGMAIGGYCPGTSSVALASGRLDGLFFMIGMVLGSGLFAGVFEPIKGFYLAAARPTGADPAAAVRDSDLGGDRHPDRGRRARLCARFLAGAARRRSVDRRAIERKKWGRRSGRAARNHEPADRLKIEKGERDANQATEISVIGGQPVDHGSGNRGDDGGSDAGGGRRASAAGGAGHAQPVRPEQSVRAGGEQAGHA